MIVIATVPPLVNIKAKLPVGSSYLLGPILLTVTETDTTLSNQRVAGFVDWGNGIPPVQFTGSTTNGVPSGVSNGIPIQAPAYIPGFYQLHIRATNFRQPNPDQADQFITLSLAADSTATVPTGVVVGPILPADQGAPSELQWNFNEGSDLDIIRSSVKMLLITSVGDRLMAPKYGTNLRNFLFENDPVTVETLARQDISTALQQWEPRAILQSFKATASPDQRAVSIKATFLSLLTNEQFTIAQPFAS